MGLPYCHTLVMSLSDSANGAVGSMARTIWVAGSIATTTPLPPIHPMASGAQMATPASMRTLHLLSVSMRPAVNWQCGVAPNVGCIQK